MPRHLVKFTKYTDKERILKAARERTPYPTGGENSVSQQISPRKLAGQKGMAGYIQWAEWEKYVVKNILSSKTVIQNKRRDKEFLRQTKTKGV